MLPTSVARRESLFGSPEGSTVARRPEPPARPSTRNPERPSGRESDGHPDGPVQGPADKADASEEEKARNQAIRDLFTKYPELSIDTPLWYYILKEAEANGGHHLGPVGGRIVAEVLVGLLCGDPLSYLSVEPNWKPYPELVRVRGRFTLSDLIHFSERARPLRDSLYGGEVSA